MITAEEIQLSYQYFYQKIYSQPKYNFNYTEKSERVVTKFLGFCDKRWSILTLGKNFMWNYLLFQFQYWDGLTITSFNQKMDFTFIFGEKAFKRYIDRDVEYDWQTEESRLISKYGLSEGSYNRLFKERKENEFYRHPTRLATLNQPTGLNNCLQLTTLYDFKDLSCLLCIYKTECKKLLELNYPEIYQSRNYGRK